MKVDLIRCVGESAATWKHARRPGIYGYVDGAKVTWTPSKGWLCRECGTACPHIDAMRMTVADCVTQPHHNERKPG